MSTIICKNEIENWVKTVHKYAKLPGGISFTIENRVLNVMLRCDIKNMQDDDAAFEAWIIFLMSHFGSAFNSVVLYLDNIILSPRFNQLLWRISNFKKMFPWFDVDPDLSRIVENFLKNVFNNVKVNEPSCARSAVINSDGERFVEWKIKSQNPNPLKSLTCCDELENQIPVGIFSNYVSKDSRIFPGGASAIDLMGLDKENQMLHVFELKIKDNCKMGIISEYLYYIQIVYNIFVTKQINYEGYVSLMGCANFQNFRANRIVGHLMAEKFHPLLDRLTIGLLNQGLSTINITTDLIKYEFDADIGGINKIDYYQN